MSQLIDECNEFFSKKQLFYKDNDGNIYLGVKQLCIDVEFTVYVAGTATPIQNATVTCGTSSGVTDASGQVTLCCVVGLSYTVAITSYTTGTGTITIAIETVNLFLAETTTLHARYTGTYTAAQLAGQNAFIYGIHNLFSIPLASTIGAKFDTFYMLAAANEADAKLNWVNTSHTITAVNAPGYVAFRGYTGDMLSSYLNTNYNPNTNKVNLTQTSGTLMIYSRTNSALAAIDTGVYISSADDQFRMSITNASNNIAYGCMNDASVSHANANSSGLFTITRRGANDVQAYRNGVNLGTNANAASAIPNGNVYICCVNTVGVGPAFYTNRQYAFHAICSGISTANNLAFYNLLNTYLTLIGAAV